MPTLQPPPLPATSRPRRSLFVTLLACAIIGISALITPISFISLLMIVAKSYGTASTTLAGFLEVVVLPPAALIAGIGLLLRKAWGRYGVIGLLIFLMILSVTELLTPPRPATTHTSPSGVTTTTMATGPSYIALPVLIVCAGLLIRLLMPVVRAEFAPVRVDDVMEHPSRAA